MGRQTQLKKHPQYLKRLGYRCQFCGQKHLGCKVDKRYRPYNFHHADSAAYGNERPGKNYLLLCKGCHAYVHQLGGESLTPGAVRRQKARSVFPNGPQRLFNFACQLGGWRFVIFMCGWLAAGCFILVT